MITIPTWWLYVLCALAGAGAIAAIAVLWAVCYTMATYLNDRYAAQQQSQQPPETRWTPR